jgi:hypothetical protein
MKKWDTDCTDPTNFSNKQNVRVDGIIYDRFGDGDGGAPVWAAHLERAF